MQRASPENPEQRPQHTGSPATSISSSQYGSARSLRPGSVGSSSSRSASPRSVHAGQPEPLDAIDAQQLGARLRGLNLSDSSEGRRRVVGGQRILDYENALTPSTPRQAMGFKVIRRRDSSGGPQLADFPNEILTHILSHLHPDSHASVALVSKRFYALVTTPHAWRMAFMRYFVGHTALESKSKQAELDGCDEASDRVRLETRYFGRLTPLSTWRSEYLFRTRLIRSLVRGKPGTSSGSIGSSGRTMLSGKKNSAVLTYTSKLPWLVTNIHAVLSNGKKPPRAIHGAGDLGLATLSDPTSGKIEKWGLQDPYLATQLQEAVPNIVPYGLGVGPAATPNVMDVSQPYGMLLGEGFPGGRAYFRGVNESCGRFLGGESLADDSLPDIPKIPETKEAICSVWIAKSSAVPSNTHSMCGMFTGSTLGVVTAYSLGWDPSGPRYSSGDMAARWVLSPGVPIISIKIDDNYSPKRKSSTRVWAVALNALGEVFYLTESPTISLNRADGDSILQHAWGAGRSAHWHLVEATRRIARSGESEVSDAHGAYSPRTSSLAMGLSQDQLVAEAREVEKFMHLDPARFRELCEGWDMQRRLEVDFAADDDNGAGEGIFVIDCGLAEDREARICRWTRSIMPTRPRSAIFTEPVPSTARAAPSIFGTPEPDVPEECASAKSSSPPSRSLTRQTKLQSSARFHDWYCSTLDLKALDQVITSSSLDCSSTAVLTLAEDPLHAFKESTATGVVIGKEDAVTGEIPGRRARLLAVGTKSGMVITWNARQNETLQRIRPVRVIQTESPEITCLAVSALYLVHGGSDGLVQAWDPLASTADPLRTLNARSNGRVPRHMLAMNPTLRNANYCAAGAMYLDPDPTVLRGVVSFGAFLRYWSYSSAGHPTGRKRRHRHSDIHGRLASRRLGGAVSGYIAAEEAEIRREKEQRAREQARLHRRFGLGALGDLTEEEALHYAQMVSEEAYFQEEQRRASDSAADASVDTASSFSETTIDTTTPEPSVTDVSPQPEAPDDEDNELEQQIQQAIRLSLLEGVNGQDTSPQNSPGELGFSIKFKPKGGKKGRRSSSTSPSASHTPMNGAKGCASWVADARNEDEELALALSLSMQDQQAPTSSQPSPDVSSSITHGDFPPLDSEGAGKGKGKGGGRGSPWR